MTPSRPPGRSSRRRPGRRPQSPQESGGRRGWRAAVATVTALGTPVGIGVADPLLGHVAAAIEVAAVLVIVGTALFGSNALSERAFRLLRLIGDGPEPPGPATPTADPVSPLSGPPQASRGSPEAAEETSGASIGGDPR